MDPVPVEVRHAACRAFDTLDRDTLIVDLFADSVFLDPSSTVRRLRFSRRSTSIEVEVTQRADGLCLRVTVAPAGRVVLQVRRASDDASESMVTGLSRGSDACVLAPVRQGLICVVCRRSPDAPVSRTAWVRL